MPHAPLCLCLDHPRLLPLVGSPSSSENDDRTEAKLDALLRITGGEKAEQWIADIDERFLRHHGHAKPHGNAGAGQNR